MGIKSLSEREKEKRDKMSWAGLQKNKFDIKGSI